MIEILNILFKKIKENNILKKIISLIIASVLLTIIIILTYNFVQFIRKFDYKGEEYNSNLSIYRYELRNRLLSKMKYQIDVKMINYKKERYNIIITENDSSKRDEWIKWVDKGKRLIYFIHKAVENSDNYQYYDNSDDYQYNESENDENKNSSSNKTDIIENLLSSVYSNYETIKIDSKELIFENVKEIILNVDRKLYFTEEEIKDNNIETLLSYNGSNYIARERLNDGEIIYISDSSVFSDKYILEKDNAKLLNNLLKPYFNDKIVFDYYEKKEVEPAESLPFIFTFNFLFLFLHIFILVVLYFLVHIKRFGNPIIKGVYENRAVDRHLDAVGVFFSKSKNPHILTNILDQYFFHRLNEIIKLNNKSESSIFNTIKSRFGMSESDQILFNKDKVRNIFYITIEREKYLKKLKKG